MTFQIVPCHTIDSYHEDRFIVNAMIYQIKDAFHSNQLTVLPFVLNILHVCDVCFHFLSCFLLLLVYNLYGQIHSRLKQKKKKKIYRGRILQRALNQLQSHLTPCCDQHQQVVHLLSGYEVSKGCRVRTNTNLKTTHHG